MSTLQTDAIPTTHPIAESGVDASIDSVRYDEEGEIAAEDASPISQIAKPAVPLAGVEQACHTEDIAEDAIADGSNTLDVNLVADALQSTSVEESQPLRRIVSSPEHVLKTTEEKERHQYVEPNALETPAVVESAKFEPSEPTNSTNISHHSATTPQTSADATLDHHVPSLGDALNLAASTNIGVGGNAPVHNDTTHSSPNTSHVIPTIEDEIPEPTNKLGEQAESPVHQHAESTPVDEALTHSTSESHPTDAEVGQESYTEPEIIAEHSKQTDGGFTAPTVEHAEPEHVVPTDPVEAKEADDTTTTATIVKADGSSEGTSEPVSGSDVHTDTLSGDGEELPSTAVQAEPIETKEVSHADVPEDVITGANAEAGHAPSGVDVTQVATAAVSVESEPTLLASELPEHEQSANVDPTKHEIDLISFDDPKPPIPDHEFMVERSVPAAVAAENDEHVSEKESSWPSRPHHEFVNEQDLASESNGHVSQNVETKPPIPHHETPSEMVVAPAVEAVAHDHVSDKAETNPTTVQADEKAPINDLELSLQTDIPPSGEREIDSTQQEEKTPPSVHNDHSIHTVLDDEHRDPIHEGDADPKEVEQTLSGRDVENGDSVPSVMEGDGVQATSGVSDNTPDTQEDTVPSDAGHVAQISDIDDARTPMAKHTMLHAEGPYISTGSNKNEPALDARPPTDDDHFKEIWASAVIANTHESNENEPVPDVQPTKDDDHFKDLWASAITANSHAQYPPDSPVPIGDEAVTSPIPEVSIEHPTPGTEEVLTPGLEEPQSDEETHPEHSTPAAVTVSTDRSDEEKRLTEDDKTDSAELLTPTAEETPGESATAAELIAPASMKIPEEPEVPNAAPHEPAADTLNFAKDASPTSQTAEAPDATGTSDGTVGPDHEKTILNDDNVGDIPAVAAVKEEIGDEVAPEVAIDGHADLHDESISTTEFTPPAVSEPAGPVSAESVPEPDSNEVAVSTDKEFSDTTTTISDSAYLTSEDVNPVPQPIASATEKVASASLPDGETVLQANTVGAEESLEHEPSSNIPSYSVTAQGQAPVNDSRKLVRDSAAADIHHVASEHSPDKMGEAKSSIEEVQPLAAVSSTHASTSDAQEIHVVALQEETAHAEFSDVQDGNEQSLPSDVTVHEATVSSFTPSYSVTVQGANELKPTTSEHIDAPPLDEPPANANDQLSQDDTSDADASTPRQISEPLQPSELPSQIPEGEMADDVIQDKNALSVERATGPTEIANYEASNDIIRPKSPYAPSYAVTQQGPGTPPATNDDAEPELFADETDLRSDIPEVPMSPRSELAMYTPTFDSRSEVSVASLEPLPPASPRLDPEELIVPETTTDETTAAPTLNLTDLPHGEEEIGTATPLPTYRQPEWSHDEPTASDMDRVESAVSEAGVPAASSGYSAGDEKSTVESTDHNDERSFGVPDSPNVESAVEVTSDVVQPGVLSSPEPDGQHVTLGSGVTEPTAGERSEPSADQAVVVDVDEPKSGQDPVDFNSVNGTAAPFTDGEKEIPGPPQTDINESSGLPFAQIADPHATLEPRDQLHKEEIVVPDIPKDAFQSATEFKAAVDLREPTPVLREPTASDSAAVGFSSDENYQTASDTETHDADAKPVQDTSVQKAEVTETTPADSHDTVPSISTVGPTPEASSDAHSSQEYGYESTADSSHMTTSATERSEITTSQEPGPEVLTSHEFTTSDVDDHMSDLTTIRDDSTQAGPVSELPDIPTPVAVSALTTPEVEHKIRLPTRHPSEHSEVAGAQDSPIDSAVLRSFAGEREVVEQPSAELQGDSHIETFPAVEPPPQSKPVLAPLTTVPEDAVDDGPASSNLEIPTNRRRLESTTSSRFIPGGWFSGTPTLPERTSMDVAEGTIITPKRDESPSSAIGGGMSPGGVSDAGSGNSKRSCIIM